MLHRLRILQIVLLGFLLILGSISQAVVFIPFSFYQSGRILFTTSAPTIFPEVCSTPVTVQRSLGGKAQTANNPLVVSLSSTGTTAFYSDPACSVSISSITISASASSANVYIKSSAIEAATITASANAYVNATQSVSSVANPFVWTGNANDNIWSSNANWSGSVAPGSSDVATFDGTCVTFCSPNISSANVNVAGVVITSGFSGTITQLNPRTITVAARGWVQRGGTFVGSVGGDSISITNSGPFYISAGSFTSTNGTFSTVTTQWNVLGTGVFNSGGGTVSLSSATSSSINFIPGTGNYNHVQFTGSNISYAATGTLNVLGTLTLNSGTQSNMSSGTISAQGDVVITGNGLRGSGGTLVIAGSTNQNINASAATIGAVPSLTISSTGGNVSWSGTITVNGNYTYNSGAMLFGSSTLIFSQSTSGLTLTPGGITYGNVTLTSSTTNSYTNSGTWTIGGTLTFNSTNSFVASINGGTIVARGNVVITNFGFRGTTQLQVAGSGNQTIDGSASSFPSGGRGGLLPTTILSTGGTVSLVGSIYVNSSFIVSTGTLSAGTSILGFTVPPITFNPGGATFHHVQIYVNNPGSSAIITNSLVATGNVMLGGGYAGVFINMPNPGAGYNLTVTGNLNISTGATLNMYGATRSQGSLTNNGTINP